MTTLTGSYSSPTIYLINSIRSRSPTRSYSSLTLISPSVKPELPVSSMTSSYHVTTHPFSPSSSSSGYSDSLGMSGIVSPQSCVWETMDGATSSYPSIDSGMITFDFSLPNREIVIDRNNSNGDRPNNNSTRPRICTSKSTTPNSYSSAKRATSSRRFSVGVVSPVKRSSSLRVMLSGDRYKTSLDHPTKTRPSQIQDGAGEDSQIYRSTTEIPVVRRHSIHTTDHSLRRLSPSADIRENKYRVYDEDTLVYLLQQCADFPERRKIREALRNIREAQHEQKEERCTYEIEAIRRQTSTYPPGPVTETSTQHTPSCLMSTALHVEEIVPISTSTPRGSGEGNSTPRDSCEGSPTLRDSGEGSSIPRDSGEGSSTPMDSGEGSSSPMDSGEGKSTPRDSGEGKSSPVDSGEGKSTPRDSGEGSSTPRDSGEGSSSPMDSGEGKSTPRDSGEGNSSPVDSGEGKSTPRDSGEGNSTPRDSAEVTLPRDYSDIKTDEELRDLLLETEDHLEKRKIRTAIRELKKRVTEEEKRGQAVPEKDNKSDSSIRSKQRISSRPQTGSVSRPSNEARTRPRATATTATGPVRSRLGARSGNASSTKDSVHGNPSIDSRKSLDHNQDPVVHVGIKQERVPGGTKRTVVKTETTHTSVSHSRGQPTIKRDSGSHLASSSTSREVTRTLKGRKPPDGVPEKSGTSAKETGQRRRRLPDVSAIAARHRSGDKDGGQALSHKTDTSSTVISIKSSGNNSVVNSSRIDSSTFTRKKVTTKAEILSEETVSKPLIPTIVISDECDLPVTEVLSESTVIKSTAPRKYYNKKGDPLPQRPARHNDWLPETKHDTNNSHKLMKPVDEPSKTSRSGKKYYERAFTDLLDNFETANDREVDTTESDILDLNSDELLNVENEIFLVIQSKIDDGNCRNNHSPVSESGEETVTGESSLFSELSGTCTPDISVDKDTTTIMDVQDRAALENMLSSSRDSELRTTLRDLKSKQTDGNGNHTALSAIMEGQSHYEEDRLGEVQLEEGNDGSITVTDVQKFDQGQRIISVTTKKKRSDSEAEYSDQETIVVTTFESPAGTKYEEKDVVKTSRKLTSKGSFYVKTDTVCTKRAFTREGEQTVEEDHVVETDNKSVSLGKSWGDKTLTSMVVNKPQRELSERSIDTIHEEVDGAEATAVEKEPVHDSNDNIEDTAPKPSLNTCVTEKEVFDMNRAKPSGIPDIVSPLKDQQVFDGSMVTLECQGHAVPPPEALWYTGSEPISETAYFKLTYDGQKASMTITEVFPDDEGEYRCVFRNCHGVAETRCRLIVKGVHGDEVPSITEALEDVTITQGSAVDLHCQIRGTGQVFWHKEGTRIENSPRFQPSLVNGTASLHIQAATVEDSGQYSCSVKNANGESSSICQLLVSGCPSVTPQSPEASSAPAFVVRPVDQSAPDGEEAVFECCITGHPRPSVMWYRKGKLLKNSSETPQTYVGQTARLVVKDVFQDDEGRYECVAQNEEGKSSVEIYLSVKEVSSSKERADPVVTVAPVFHSHIRDKTVTDGETAVFVCDITGSPQPIVTWYWKNNALTEGVQVRQSYDGQTARLELRALDADDEGTYRCEAVNSAGTVSQQARLDIDVKGCPPDILNPLFNCTATVGKSFKFLCRISGDPPPIVKWYKEGRELQQSELCKPSYEDNIARLELKQLKLSDQGLYECKGRNKLGEASTSCQFTIKGESIAAKATIKLNLTSVSKSTADSDILSAQPSLPNHCSINPSQPQSSVSQSTKDQSHLYSGPETTVVRSCSPPGVVRNCSPPGVVRSCSPPGVVSCSSPGVVRSCSLPGVVRSCSPPNAKIYKPNSPSSHMNCEESPSSSQSPNVSPLPGQHHTGTNTNNQNGKMAKSSAVGRLQDFFGSLMTNESVSANRSVSQGPERALYERSPQHEIQVEDMKSSFVVKKQDRGPLQFNHAKGVLRADERYQSSGGSGLHYINMSSVKIMEIEDEEELHKLLNTTDNFEDRKMVRARLKELREKAREEWERGRKEREAAAVDVVKLRQQKADEDKKKKMQTFQTRAETASKDNESLYLTQTQKDLKDRQRVADEDKRKKLESYKQIAKTGSGVTETRVTTTKTADGDKTTTTTTKTVTMQQSGFGGTQYGTPAPRADHVANNIADRLQQVTSPYTSGKITVRTESWNSRDGITQKCQTTQRWGAPANKPAGPRGAMAAFKQMDTANPGAAKPNALVSVSLAKKAASTMRKNAVTIKAEILDFCKSNTAEYQTVQITNFSSSWNNGMAFCAVIHHFFPDAFDFNSLDPKERRKNFTLAFDTAEKCADISPLLDVDDMVKMKNPDWKCVFCYVQSLYRHLRTHEANKQIAPTQ